MESKPDLRAGRPTSVVGTGPAVVRSVWAVVVLAGLAGMWLGMPSGSTGASVASADAGAFVPDNTPGAITVHVSGWVLEPGLVELPGAARVADAVAAAGGALPGARLDGLNLAEEVADGDRIDVPGPGVAQASEPGTAGGGDGLVDINRAGLAELETLPGVGPVLAQRIIDHRDAHGRFDTVEDLLAVSGIGERKLESLRQHIEVP